MIPLLILAWLGSSVASYPLNRWVWTRKFAGFSVPYSIADRKALLKISLFGPFALINAALDCLVELFRHDGSEHSKPAKW